MSERCSACGYAPLSEERTRYLHQAADAMLIVEDVPCLQCDRCGEGYFAIADLKKIEADHAALAAHRKHPSRFLQVPVEEYPSL